MALSTPVVVILLLSLLPRTNSQKLPSRDESHFRFHISHAEIFHDTKHLPDGAEVTAYLYKDITRKYFFIIEEGSTPVSITIKPCASAVHWKLSLHDLPDEHSATGGSDDELMRQLELKKQGQSKGTHLKEYSGHSASSYTTTNTSPGIFVIELSALDSDASVKFYATTTPDSDQPYPELPANADIEVVRATRKSIQVSWQPSPSAALHVEPVEYCVSVNKKRNFHTRCDAVAHIVGEQPPTIPPNAGFGFAWENDQNNKATKRKASPVVPMKPEDASFQCIGSKTRFTFTNLNYGTNYYLNVYAVNKSNNMSAVYNGTSARTKPSRKYVNLVDGKVRLQFLKRSRGYKLYKFPLKKQTRKLIFSVHPCSGFVRVELFQESHLINKGNGRGLITFEVKSPKLAVYYVKVHLKRRRSVSYKVLATTKQSAFPYPVLPKESTIRVFDTLIKCDRMTVAWLGTSKRQQYCLYKRVIEKRPKRHRLMLNSCHGPSLRKKSEKIVCKTFRSRNKKKAVMSEMITGLRANTTYGFDLYVSKIGGETLSYKSVYARTLGQC